MSNALSRPYSLSRLYPISSIKDLSVQQIAHLDFPLILFSEIKTNYFGNILTVCLLHFLQ